MNDRENVSSVSSLDHLDYQVMRLRPGEVLRVRRRPAMDLMRLLSTDNRPETGLRVFMMQMRRRGIQVSELEVDDLLEIKNVEG